MCTPSEFLHFVSAKSSATDMGSDTKRVPPKEERDSGKLRSKLGENFIIEAMCVLMVDSHRVARWLGRHLPT